MNREHKIEYNGEIIPYELIQSKIKYMNHAKEFWNLVENYMPEYKKCKNMLKSK